MAFILAFHPDNHIRRDGKLDIPLAMFREANPNVPLVDGQWFQLDNDRLIIMNEKGEGSIFPFSDYQKLVDSILTPAKAPVGKIYPLTIHPHAYLELDDMIVAPLDSKAGIPVGFTVVDNVQVWEYREFNEQELVEHINAGILAEIKALEDQVTQRRIREAISDPTWLNNIDKQINDLRAQIIK